MYPDIEQKHGITLKQANDLLRDLQARHGEGQSILASWGSATERANQLERENALLREALKSLHMITEEAVEYGLSDTASNFDEWFREHRDLFLPNAMMCREGRADGQHTPET